MYFIVATSKMASTEISVLTRKASCGGAIDATMNTFPEIRCAFGDGRYKDRVPPTYAAIMQVQASQPTVNASSRSKQRAPDSRSLLIVKQVLKMQS